MSQENNSTKVTQADETVSFVEHEAVVATLMPYIEAAKTGETGEMRKVFYDHARVIGSSEGDAVDVDIDTFASLVTQGGPSPEVQHHIALVDITGSAAVAKVEFRNWGGARYTDYFTLYKSEGVWKIANKVYDAHSKN